MGKRNGEEDTTIVLSIDAAYKIEEVRNVMYLVNGTNPDNSEVISLVCNRFMERIKKSD